MTPSVITINTSKTNSVCLTKSKKYLKDKIMRIPYLHIQISLPSSLLDRIVPPLNLH